MSKSKQYWIDRMLARDKAAKLSEDKLLKELNKYYTNSFLEIEKELNNFYVKYATENGLSYTQAKRLLKPLEIKEYTNKLDKLKEIYKSTGSREAYLKMQELGSRANITRLQSLLDGIDIELTKCTNNVQINIEQHLSSMYKKSYKQALEDIGAINKVINSRAVKEALEYPWSGKNFSQSLWGNKAKTFETMQNTITKGIIQGQSVPKVAKNIKDLSALTFNTDKSVYEMEKIFRYNAERLVRTETTYFMTRGHIEGYKESGVVEALQIDEYIDGRTCSACKDKDGTIVKLSEVIYGDNVPPFHPGCRGTVIPIIEE